MAMGLVLAVGLTACGTGDLRGSEAAAQPAAAHHPHACPGDATSKLHDDMRVLWAQHMEWTYAVVAAFAAGTDNLQASIDRLLANQDHIGAAIAPFYGDAAAARLTELLRDHITGAVPVLTAAKAGNTADLEEAVDAWFANAREIADFLASANPNWPRGEMRHMMRDHISQTLTYASSQLQGEYAASISQYGTAEAHMMAMADMLTAGLVAQFPERFE
jgi:hypothetical protein